MSVDQNVGAMKQSCRVKTQADLKAKRTWVLKNEPKTPLIEFSLNS